MDEKVETVRITLTQAQVQALRWSFEQAEQHREVWESEFVLPSVRTTARIVETRAQHAAAARVAEEVLAEVAGVWDDAPEEQDRCDECGGTDGAHTTACSLHPDNIID